MERVGESEHDIAKNPSLGAATHSREVSYQSDNSLGGVRDWYPVSGTPTLGICIGETGPQNVWFRKPMRLMFKGPKMLAETEIPPLKGLHVVSLTLRSRDK